MNRYTVSIKTGDKNNEMWRFVIFTDGTKEYVRAAINDVLRIFEYESPVKLIEDVCNMYDWKWENFVEDVIIRM